MAADVHTPPNQPHGAGGAVGAVARKVWPEFHGRLIALLSDPTPLTAAEAVAAAEYLFALRDANTHAVSSDDVKVAADALATIALHPSVPDDVALRAGILLDSRRRWRSKEG